VKGSFKKYIKILDLSRFKIILILIIIFFLILGGLAPALNSILINKNNELSKKESNNKNNEEYKDTSLYDDVWAIASFYWRPKYPDPMEKITFYSTSFASNGFISSERWEFDDGHKDYGHRTTHTFEKKGSYKVTLHVTAHGFKGGFSWNCRTYYVTVGGDPFPKIKCKPENPSPGEQVILDGSESSDPDGEIISYKWSFYDVKNPENVIDLGSSTVIYHTWTKQGTYVVLLYTEDDKGNNNTIELTIDVSILKLIDFDTFSRGITFKIRNYGNITANNIRWKVEIFRESLLKIRSKSLYQKSNTITYLYPDGSRTINLNDIRRRICKIKLVVTAEADNAVKICKTYYGRIIGKFIHLSEEENRNPLIDAFKFIIPFGVGLILLIYIYNIIQYLKISLI